MHSKRFALAIALGTIGPVPVAHRADAEPTSAGLCPVAGEETARVAAIETKLEIRLVDGRRLRLVGLDPPMATPGDPDLDDRARQAFQSLIPDQKLVIRLMSPKPDRWGRLPAIVFAETGPGAGEPGGLATAALSSKRTRLAPMA